MADDSAGIIRAARPIPKRVLFGHDIYKKSIQKTFNIVPTLHQVDIKDSTLFLKYCRKAVLPRGRPVT